MKISGLFNKLLLGTFVFACAYSSAYAQTQKGIDMLNVHSNGKIVYQVDVNNIDSIGFAFAKRQVKIIGKDGSTLYSIFRNYIDSLAFSYVPIIQSYPQFNLGSANGMSAAYDNNTKEYTFTTTNTSPNIYTTSLDSAIAPERRVLSFEYQCTQGVNNLKLYFGNVLGDYRSQNLGAIPATGAGEWNTYSCDLGQARDKYDWGNSGHWLRVDFGSNPGVTIKIRGINFRTQTEEEKAASHKTDSIYFTKRDIARHLRAYLDTVYSNAIDSVYVSQSDVEIFGHYDGEGEHALVEVPPYEDITEVKRFPYRTELNEKKFSVKLPRVVERENYDYDRLLSKWAIVKAEADSDLLVSHAHFADSVMPTYSAKPGVLANKKGIGAGRYENRFTYYADFDSLKVGSITANIVLDWVFSDKPYSGYRRYTYGGHTYYINPTAINQYDEMMIEAQKRNIVVLGILLVNTNSIFKDPENTGGLYTMPNMTTLKAVQTYAAGLNYLANRYASGEYGRVHHWIMHNEVDQNGGGANMGDQPETRFNDRYNRSMRMFYNILRQYDQNAYVLGSYTHFWNILANDFSTRFMIEENQKFSNAEGDYKWGIAAHPYPFDLFAPEYWINDTGVAPYNNDALAVTFQNPEVINAWVKDPKHFYKGKTKRLLFFSENGTNSRNYSDEQLNLQAAGAALIWKKIEQLDGIDGIQWHNWQDNRTEDGLRIGLRAWADAPFTKELAPKPVWYVWKAAGTPDEDKVFQPYLKVLGIPNWNNIIHTVK